MAVITGNVNGNPLNGTAGDDTIFGLGGNDTLNGFGGSDEIFGGSGADYINPGEDTGGAVDSDLVEGGVGDDTIDFSDIVQSWVGLRHNELTGPITVNIDGLANTGSVDAGAEGTDTLINVANPLNSGWTTGGLQVVGTNDNDTFTINTDTQQWMDVVGTGGDDSITITGNGLVRVSYHFSTGAVVADLGAGTIQQDGFTDTVSGVWEIRASDNNDNLLGSADDESFIGRGGSDTIDGAGGFDRVRYDRIGNDSGVTVDLNAGTAQGTWNGTAFTDTLSNIEWVRGSNLNDIIVGNGVNNHLEGEGGNDVIVGTISAPPPFAAAFGGDTLDGGDGDDILVGGLAGDAGNDFVNGDAGNDTLLGGNGNDTLGGGADFDIIGGGNGNDSLEGDGGNDTLLGQGGNDVLNGGAGDDVISGGTGVDVATGDIGADIFAYTLGDGVLTITDFEAGVDDLAIIGAPAGTTFADIAPLLSQDGLDVVIGGGATEIRWQNTLVADLGADDFIFV